MDKLIKTISASGTIRVFALESTQTVQTAQRLHKISANATIALGRTLIASQVLAANEKGETKLTVKILGDGKLGAIIAVADTHGRVKGYLQGSATSDNEGEQQTLSALIGKGQFLVITDYGIGTPYHSMTPIISGEIGEDLAYFLTESQQVPSAVGINVLLDEKKYVKTAGGFLVQALPGAKQEELARFEERIQTMPSISQLLTKKDGTTALLNALYGGEPYKYLKESPLSFACDCSKERFKKALVRLPISELQTMKKEDRKVEITCQFCHHTYLFNERELEEMIHATKN